MMSQVMWADLTVSDFFWGYNWLGDVSPLPSLEVPDEAESEPTSVWGLSVGEFFHRTNWQGKVLTPKLRPPARVVKNLSITMSVAEFFGGMDWKGQFAIAATESPKSPPATSQDLKIDQLSDLF